MNQMELRHNEISPKQYEWRNHWRIYRWTRQNGPITKEHHERWLESYQKDPSIKMFGVVNDDVNLGDSKQNLIVGTAGFTSIRPEHGSAEFSLLIDPDQQRKGYGKAALIRLFQHGFKEMRLHCIWGETFVNNPAYKLFQDLGMKTDGLLRQRYFKNGEYVDAYAISILAEEAKQQPWWN